MYSTSVADTPDTSAEAVERLAAEIVRCSTDHSIAPAWRERKATLAAATLRALVHQRDGWKEAFDRSTALRDDDARDLAAAVARAEAAERERDDYRQRVEDMARLMSDAADCYSDRDAATARAEAAEARIAELSLYRSIVSAWLAGKGLIPELDAHFAALPEGDRPVDPERDALVAVARAARKFVADTRAGNAETAFSFDAVTTALDALPPGVLDQSSG